MMKIVLACLLCGSTLAGCATAPRERIACPGEEPLERAPEAMPPPAPPPPGIAVTLSVAPSVSKSSLASSRNLLTALEGRFLRVRDGAVGQADLASCHVAQGALRACVEQILSTADEPPGSVVVIVSQADGGALHWTCIGNPRTPFDPTTQEPTWNRDRLPDASTDQWPLQTLREASACLTNAGRQSGW